MSSTRFCVPPSLTLAQCLPMLRLGAASSPGGLLVFRSVTLACFLTVFRALDTVQWSAAASVLHAGTPSSVGCVRHKAWEGERICSFKASHPAGAPASLPGLTRMTGRALSALRGFRRHSPSLPVAALGLLETLGKCQLWQDAETVEHLGLCVSLHRLELPCLRAGWEPAMGLVALLPLPGGFASRAAAARVFVKPMWQMSKPSARALAAPLMILFCFCSLTAHCHACAAPWTLQAGGRVRRAVLIKGYPFRDEYQGGPVIAAPFQSGQLAWLFCFRLYTGGTHSEECGSAI